MSAKATVTNFTKVVQVFSSSAQSIALLEPGERLRVLAALIALFDPDTANWLIDRWRGE